MTAQTTSKLNGQPFEQELSNIKYISWREGSAVLNRQARKYLNMSGEEFKKQYHDGTIADPDRSAVIRVSMLPPLAEK